jgi:hypothetical protein
LTYARESDKLPFISQVEGKILATSERGDLRLSNGAHLNFKVRNDQTGNPVVSSIEISFAGSEIPPGGIGATVLREIRISDLLTQWFVENSRFQLSKKIELRLWKQLKDNWVTSGRQGNAEENLAALAYFYVKYSQKHPNKPTSALADDLEIPVKTLQTRLLQLRKEGLLETAESLANTGKAHGQMSVECMRIINRSVDKS